LLSHVHRSSTHGGTIRAVLPVDAEKYSIASNNVASCCRWEREPPIPGL
jgi:hypothetical protein